ncbi:MAG TPA: hypothetical protein VLK65_16570 [Vicinamibacteria bacterium]|nr:hypothetical protein [Vicinamibacteria bacterium]
MVLDSRRRKKNLVAQWAFDTSPILGRFHLWLEDVEVELSRIDDGKTRFSFLPLRLEAMMAMTAAVTALGTKLYGRFGEGDRLDKVGLNQVKKDADAISAYAMSEALWYATRQLPENHAVMVSLGEGLMPKLGETPEMGSNPQLGFGRVYARPQVAKWVDARVMRLINERGYVFEEFYDEAKSAGITIWGAAIDTLENTSRFAKGEQTGPLTVLHLFDQPLQISRPYEGYVGNLLLPKDVAETAAERSVLIDYRCHRERVVEAIEWTYPGIRRENIHVWTLGGASREKRLGALWSQWRDAGVHLVEDGWKLPSGLLAFNDSGSYAPTYHVRAWRDEASQWHVFLCDGYAGSAEAMQAASLAPVLELEASLSVLTSKFVLSSDKEWKVMALSPEASDFEERLKEIAGASYDDTLAEQYREAVRAARDAGMPVERSVVSADDFFPERRWRVLAACGYICRDPYSGAEAVEELGEGLYRVTTALATRKGRKRIRFTLRMMEKPDRARLVFNPLLVRFLQGENFRERPVRISDSGRVRNELQTLCSEALDYEGSTIRIDFARIRPEVISKEHQLKLREILDWYKEEHPVWFRWLEIAG